MFRQRIEDFFIGSCVKRFHVMEIRTELLWDTYLRFLHLGMLGAMML